MAFQTKKDWFGLASTNLELKSANENASLQTLEQPNESGEIIAHEEFGSGGSPSCSYVSKAAQSVSIVLGEKSADNVVITSAEVKTSVGGEIDLNCSGTLVPADATAGCTCTFPLSMPAEMHAKIMDSAFTLTGGVLTDCTIKAEADFVTSTVNGDIVQYDIVKPRVTVSATIAQTGTTACVVTAGDRYTITSPLTKSEPDSAYPTYTVTLVKYLSLDV